MLEHQTKLKESAGGEFKAATVRGDTSDDGLCEIACRPSG